MHGEAPDEDADRVRGDDETGLELLRAVLDRTSAAIAVTDGRLRWVHANPAFEAAAGVRSGELLGLPVTATALAALSAALSRALADRLGREVLLDRWGGEVLLDPPPGEAGPAGPPRWSCRRVELRGRAAGVVVTLAPGPALPGGAPSRPAPGGAAEERLALARAADERVGTTLDADTTCVELAEFAIAGGLADIAAVDLLPDAHSPYTGGRIRLRRCALAARRAGGADTSGLPQPGESVRHQAGAPTAEALTGGRAVAVDLGEDAGPTGEGPPAADRAFRAAGAHHLLVLPLIARGRSLGVLHLARLAAGGRGFTGEDLALVGDLAGHAALALDNAQRYTRTQHVALDLQRALLAEPANPHPNLELATRYLPSGSHSVVGGDWYETVRLPFGRTLLVIEDVMGHGVEAAVDMSTYRSMLRYIAGMDLPPHRILRQLDTLISENEASRPATCLLALADPARRRWTFASAGHLPPALVTPGRPTELVRLPTGPPLGTGLADYEQTRLPLEDGQTLLLYTDGLVERRGEDIDVSLDRLAALSLPAAGDLEDLLDTVLHALAAHPAEDDTALLAARPRMR
ncbi:SpoIIE family protein phosphatase [Kitasatospora sp. NBC_00315]|uniref:SpoIIE family protein phosphatase n=1 Tax=Kitasatospora sp. NBC_00315 TaxID=2975963 RepID=UPI003247D9D3